MSTYYISVRSAVSARWLPLKDTKFVYSIESASKYTKERADDFCKELQELNPALRFRVEEIKTKGARNE